MPEEKFVPIAERILEETGKIGVIKVPERSSNFTELVPTPIHSLVNINESKTPSRESGYTAISAKAKR